MKKITLIKNKTKWINPKGYFYHSTDGKVTKNKTLVSLNYDGKFLIVDFWGNNYFYLKNNLYKNIYGRENQPLYQQEVFEIFIGKGKESPTHYLEVNINPNNAIYVSRIINEDKKGTKNKNVLLSNKNLAGIRHSVQKKFTKNTWQAKLMIPMNLIRDRQAREEIEFFRLNFFRISKHQFSTNKKWLCNPSYCEFSCWQSTYSKIQPRFHRTDYMGLLEIINF